MYLFFVSFYCTIYLRTTIFFNDGIGGGIGGCIIVLLIGCIKSREWLGGRPDRNLPVDVSCHSCVSMVFVLWC